MNYKKGIVLAILAAALYAISTPFSKLLLDYIPSVMLAGILYMGGGLSVIGVSIVRKIRHIDQNEMGLTKSELPYTIAMIVLDIVAPICLLYGLNMSVAANVSLLNNFEIVATSLIALMIFKEQIPAKLWAGIICVTIACALLSIEDLSSFDFSYGSIFVIAAACCWGLENNCTRKLASKDPLQIVMLKGIFSGLGSLIVGLLIGERVTSVLSVICALGLGCFSYGLSIYYYVYAQRLLGAARTSAFYAISPFIGSFLALVIFQTPISSNYVFAFMIMIVGAWLCSDTDG